MALQVWLPLNGDLHNQGLSNITMASNNVTIDNNGKIGKCYSFTTSPASKAYSNETINFNSNIISISCWANINSSSGAGYICGISAGSSARFMLYYNPSDTMLRCYSNANNRGTVNISTYLDSWHHYVAVSLGNEIIIYIDGQEKTTINYTSPNFGECFVYLGCRRNGSDGSGSYPFTGLLNDVRIYDHALSPKEVEEIAKGLVLHYKLDNYWFAENLLVNTHFDNRYSQTTGWDTSKNGTLLANSWGGYNPGVANASTVYHAHLKEVDGEYVYEFIKDADNSWLGISQSGLQSKLTAGTKYTFSWEQYCVSGNNYVSTGLYYYKTGASSASFHLGYGYGNSGRVIGKWQKFTYTFTAPSDADYAKNMAWYVYGKEGGNGTFYARHFKLEKGDKATPWSPAKTDTLYAALGYNGTTIYDSSGYSHNGTIVGSLTAASGSPRYDVATTFPTATSDFFYFPHLVDSTAMNNEFTFSCWLYRDYTDATERALYYGLCRVYLYTDFKPRIQWKLASSDLSYDSGNTWAPGGGGTTIPLQEWTHLVFTFNNGVLYLYINGTQYGPSDRSNTGQFIHGTQGSPNATVGYTWIGKISDVRTYATALTADQVKELYNTSMSVDSNGNIYARELSELV